MKKVIPFVILLLITGCVHYSPQFAPKSVITKIKAHTVSIATYYIMDYDTHSKFMNMDSHMIRVPIQTDGPKKAAAIIGSGTIIKDNHVVTVRHMFDNHYGVGFSNIYVFVPGLDHAVEADLVCKSEDGKFWDDYAVIKLREDVGLPGLRIGKTQPFIGDKVISSGSTGGFAFFSRFGCVTELQYHFRRGSDDILHLSPWEDFGYMVIYPGGPGDSGGSICNTKGELVGIMYCGLTNYSEEYVFANPLSLLHEFLEKSGLSHLR